jgi:hypothetical protein
MAREQYLLWIEHDPVSGDRFREITDSVAKRLPGRKPRYLAFFLGGRRVIVHTCHTRSKAFNLLRQTT